MTPVHGEACCFVCLKADTTYGVMVQARFPDDAVLDSIWDLHRVPRRRAMEWFAARREASVARPAAPPSRCAPVHTADKICSAGTR